MTTHQQGLFEDLPYADTVEAPASPRSESTPAKPRVTRIPKVSAILPVNPPVEIVQLAKQLDIHLHLGTSSWSFPSWNGLVYDGEF